MDDMTGQSKLKAAYTALKAGRKLEARRLLEQIVVQQPDEFRGWLWLASVTDSPQRALACVERAAQLNPAHPSIEPARAWARAWVGSSGKYSVSSDQDSVSSRQDSAAGEQGLVSEEAAGKRPFSPLLWAGVAVLVLMVLLLGSWLVGNWLTDNGRSVTAANQTAADQPPPAAMLAAGLDKPVGTAATAVPTITPSPTRNPIQAKAVAAAGDPLPTWTTTPTATATPTATPTPEPTFVSDRAYIQRPLGVAANERWIDINLTTQTLTAYEGDEPVFSTLISSGRHTHPTVTGQFRVWYRTRSQTMDGRRLGYNYYLENVPYVMYFYRDYAIHGTYWHNNFGTPMSHGCVNMKTEEAEWLFNWSQMGTLVNVRY
jgi:lipoprotein-anchoring transpeptidase ErfK/SrfK